MFYRWIFFPAKKCFLKILLLGSSSSRRKKGKPFKIVQWDPENQNFDENFENRDVLEFQNSNKNKKIYESVSTKHIQGSKSSNGERNKNEETLTSSVKINLGLNSSQFFEETYVYDEKSPPVSSKNKTRRLSKYVFSQFKFIFVVSFISKVKNCLNCIQTFLKIFLCVIFS